MSLKKLAFYLICGATWFLLLPVLVIGGAVGLGAYAIFAEACDLCLGRPTRTVDIRTARELAHRKCFGR